MNSGKYAGIAGPTIFAILMAVYAYWAAQRELVSSRPSAPNRADVPEPVPSPGSRTFHSRMWQDPLSTSFRHWKESKGSSAEKEPSQTVSDKDLPNRKTITAAYASAKLPPQEDDDAATEQTGRNAESALDNGRGQESNVQAIGPAGGAAAEPANAAPTPTLFTILRSIFSNGPAEPANAAPNPTVVSEGGSEPFDNKDPLQHDTKELFRDLVEGQSTPCLPVFTPGGPYAEDKERRMRIRYAVVSALAESDYHLMMPLLECLTHLKAGDQQSVEKARNCLQREQVIGDSTESSEPVVGQEFDQMILEKKDLCRILEKVRSKVNLAAID